MNENKTTRVRVPKPPSGLVIYQEDSLYLAYSLVTYFIIKRIPSKSSKGKGVGVSIRGDQLQASKGPLPVESHRMSLIPPAIKYNQTCEVLPTPHQRLRAQGFCWGQTCRHALLGRYSNFIFQKGKHKPYCLYSAGITLFSSGNGGNFPKSKFPNEGQGPILQPALPKDSSSDLLC